MINLKQYISFLREFEISKQFNVIKQYMTLMTSYISNVYSNITSLGQNVYPDLFDLERFYHRKKLDFCNPKPYLIFFYYFNVWSMCNFM